MGAGSEERPVSCFASQCDGGACVEVAVSGEGVILRSSQNPDTTLQMTMDEWRVFVAGVKGGDFDGL